MNLTAVRVLVLVSVLALFGCNEKKADDKSMAQKSADPSVESTLAIFKTKVRRVEGEVSLLKGGSGDSWKQLRHGQNVVEKDRIKTAVESETVLGVNDGTVLAITENSDVTLSAELVDSLKRKISVLITHGNVHFDVQKQRTAVFEFKTGTATSAIRGTAGFVGSVGGQTVASLKEGRIEVTNADGQVQDVVQNQTVVVSPKGSIKKMQLKSSGTKALAKAIDSLAAVAAAAGTESADESALQNSIQKFDDGYAERQKKFEAEMKFLATRIADTLYVPSVTLQARATPGMIVTVRGENDTVPANGIYQKTFEWAEDTYGTQRFLASCSNGDVEVPCYMWVTEYVSPVAEKPAIEEPAADSSALMSAPAQKANAAAGTGSDLANLKVKVGQRTEKIHLDLPAKEYSTNMVVSLDGITQKDLSEIKSLRVLRKGAVVKNFGENDMTSLRYEVPVTVALNRIADFDVEVILKNNKVYRTHKTYEVYCLRGNHMGKARNFVQYKTVEEEYEAIKQKGDLKKE